MNKKPEAFSSRLLLRSLLCLALAGLVPAGCATAPQRPAAALTESPSPSPMIAEINTALSAATGLQTPGSSPDYRLGPEDLLQITLFNIPEGEAGVTPRRTELRVSQEGKIVLPLLGDIEVAGLTTSDLEHLLRERYDPYLHNPQVGVHVTEYRSQQVSVMGAVGRPGVFQLTGPKTLIDILTMAGGITERAGNQVHIYRQGPEGRESYVIDLSALASNPGLVNMPVRAGDVVNVQQSGMFFVDGAVGRPGSYALNRPYTLTQALAVSGGLIRTLADFSDVSIFRRRDGLEAEKIPVDLRAIFDNKASDPPIRPDDVIVVPISTAKYIVDRFLGRIGLGSVTAF